MTRNRKVIYFFLGFFAMPFLAVYLLNLSPVALWIYAWFPGLVFVMFFKNVDLSIRGSLFIAWTVIISLVGSDYLAGLYPGSEMAIRSITTMVNMIAGGVGGNFIAHDIISGEQKK